MSLTYDVFARKEYPEPLAYIGSIELETPEEASQVSLERFGPACDWLEMIAVPHHAILVVFSENEEDN